MLLNLVWNTERDENEQAQEEKKQQNQIEDAIRRI